MIEVFNSYRIMLAGADVTPRVQAIVNALRCDGAKYVTCWDDGRMQIECPDEKFQRRWMRRLRSAERDDLLESDK